MLPTEWIVSDDASNDVASASKGAVAGKRHTLATVAASYSDSTVTGLLTITVTLGTTSTTYKHYIHAADVIPLEIRGDVNTAVTAALAAGGSGVTGWVNIIGHTTG